MKPNKKLRSRLLQGGVALSLTLVSTTACLAPTVPGYQVRGVPDGFLYTANSNNDVRLLPNREALSRGVWLGDIETFEPQSEIFVSRYAGTVTIEEAKSARAIQANRYGNPASIDYGQVVSVTIDGRPAYAWMETRLDENNAVRSMKYTAVIPYDTVSYAVEFDTSVGRRLHPDSLVGVVHSWGRGETEVLWSAIVFAIVGLAGLVGFFVYWSRRANHQP